MTALQQIAGDRDRTALNAICPYYTMLPLGFPIAELKRAGGDDAVLDPFCGRGTTLFAARLAHRAGDVPAHRRDTAKAALSRN